MVVFIGEVKMSAVEMCRRFGDLLKTCSLLQQQNR